MASPRNYVADANPDLSRKKQRLSNEPSSSGSAPGSPLVMDLTVEADIPDNVIMIENMDDIDGNGDLYSASFACFNGDHLPMAHLAEIVRLLQADAYFEPFVVESLSGWLQQHLSVSQDHGRELWMQKYMQDDEFFGELAVVLRLLLLRSDSLFDEDVAQHYQDLGFAVKVMVESAAKLSCRIICLLDSVTNERLSRRDSAQIVTGQQDILLLHYVNLLSLLTSKDEPPSFKNYRLDLRLNTKSISLLCKKGLEDRWLLKSLATVLQNLSANHRTVKDSWLFMSSILHIVRDHTDKFGNLIEVILEEINQRLLPAICEKHPRALPDGFHEFTANVGAKSLKTRAEDLGFSDCAELFQKYVKADDDAVLPESTSGEADTAVLWRLCEQDKDTLPWLLEAAWYLRTQKAFIFSEIIDVRTSGIKLLNKFLVDTFNICYKLDQKIDHPVAQYASRFLRANEITKYIFSANSHASLLTHSNNVVSFLAATRSYTDQETDIIWQACTTNVEAEFVKASVSVLQSVSQHLMFEHLRYIISLYSVTPVSKLSLQAADLLHELFNRLHARITEDDSDERRLAPARLAVDIFRHLNNGEHQSFTEQLRWASAVEISKATKMDSNDRFAIYQDCIPDIKDRNQRATTSTQILLFFLRVGADAEENRQLLAMLPPIEVVKEIRSFVGTELKSGPGFTRTNFAGLKDRIETAVFILQLTPDQKDVESEDMLYDHLFGDQAFNNFARNTAWTKLRELSHGPDGPRVAKELLQRYLDLHVVNMASEYATAALVEQLETPLKAFVTKDFHNNVDTGISNNPLWNTLVRFAAECTDPATSKHSVQAICNVLFSYPENFEPKAPIIQCQSEFVREYVDRLCRDFSAINGDAEVGRFCRSMDVLAAVYKTSKTTEQMYSKAQDPSILQLSTDSDGSDLAFTVRIQTPRPEQELISVLATSSTTVSELAKALPEYTHTPDSRVIIAGKLFNLQDHGPKLLTEIGILNSGVMMISPRYTSGCDVNRVLTCPGPVEQAILEQYDRLSLFIDGQDQVAQSTFLLLSNLPPSLTSRNRLSSHPAVHDVFPSDRTWRTQFSISVLQRHLQDLARMGVADEQFVLGSVGLLSDFLLDTTRPEEPHNTHLVLNCLLVFLGEKLNTTPVPSYFDEPKALVSRLVMLMSRPRDELDNHLDHDRRAIDATTQQVLLQAVKSQPDVWDSFANDGYPKELFASLLLDDHQPFSRYIANITTDFCRDDSAPIDASQFFWGIIHSTLAQAMERSTKSTFFFAASLEFLNLNPILRSKEDEVRSLIEQLIAILWTYQHTESIKCPFADCAIIGLLRLLRGAITILKGFKKPLELGELAPHLFTRLLFPDFEDSSARPLLNADSRSLVFELVKITSQSDENHHELLELTNTAVRIPERNSSASFPGHNRWIRAPQVSSGLTNLGMTCYMNSLLQQLFANLSFRNLIFTTPIVDHQRQILLSTLQDLFTSMQNGVATAAETRELAKVLGIRIDTQEDVHGFYATFMNALEESMPDENTKKALSSFFAGKFVSQIRGECGHVSTQTEPFIDLSITVKNKPSLRDSLDEFVQGEPMQGANKYRCMTCDSENGGSLVDAMKRTCLEDVPDNLTFCLKRFTFEAMMGLEGKVNDKFTFPTHIDMAAYQRVHLENPTEPYEPDKFELIGVIVHQGNSEFGHYWSFARLAGPENAQSAIWQKLEDSNATICPNGINDVLEECYGGRRWANGMEKNDNAYVLFYQRSTAAKAQCGLIEPADSQQSLTGKFPPRIAISSELSDRVNGTNIWRYRIEHVFSSDFAQFVNWLLEGYTDLRSEEGNNSGDEVATENPLSSLELVDSQDSIVSNLASAQLLDVILLDPDDGSEKLRSFVAGLNSALAVHPRLALPLLKDMAMHTMPFVNIWRFGSSKVRKMASDLVLRCLHLVKTHYPDSYSEILGTVLNAHRGIQQSELDSITSHWADYFEFVSSIAQIGLEETTMVINAGYIQQIIDIVHLLDMPQETRRQRASLTQMLRRRNVDLSPLFELLHAILSVHVDLDPRHSHSNNANAVVSDGMIFLKDQIWYNLLYARVPDDEEKWLLFFWGSRLCKVDDNWQEFSPGRLLALLASYNHPSLISQQAVFFLRSRFDIETETTFLYGLLHIALHIASSLGDSPTVRQLFNHVTKALVQWEGIEMDVLHFYTDVAEFVPLAVIDAIMTRNFIRCYLEPKIDRDRKIRLKAMRFLQDFLLGGAPDPIDVSFEAHRIATIRGLVRNYIQVVNHACEVDRDRRDYEQMIQFLQSSFTWIQNYNQTREALFEGLTQDVLRPLSTELDEMMSMTGPLRNCLLTMQGWESSPVGTSPNMKRMSGVDGLSEEEDEEFSEEEEEFFD